MTRPHIRLSPRGLGCADGWQHLGWDVHGQGLETRALRHSLPVDSPFGFGDPERGDHALCAALLYAMQHGSSITVEGSVSPRLLDGLDTLQNIWQRWRPERYRKVDIEVATESEAQALGPNRPAIFAFSGGVDASYSLFRHLQGTAGRNNRVPGAALLVHGMDIPLDREDFYDRAAVRAERILADTGVPLVRMRSNSRILGQRWEESYGLQLTGCFLLLQQHFSHAVKGSGEPYEALVLPWGSTPLTDPLASTACMTMDHDGCESDRTEKVEWLAKQTNICEYLRVCWAGPKLDQNCGECEKCVRTMLNFWAMALPVPAAFPTQLSPERVRSMKLRNSVQRTELMTLHRHAVKHHAPGDLILGALSRLIGLSGPAARTRQFMASAKRFLDRK